MPIGLYNIGNSCYLNSAIQALRHTSPIAAYFGNDAWKQHAEDEAAFTAQFADVVKRLLTTENGTVVPRGFHAEFIRLAHAVNDEIVAGAPADAAEAIQIILDALHEQVARPVNMEIHGKTPLQEYTDSLLKWKESFCQKYSPIVENYYGQTQNSVKCHRCGTISRRYEPWSIYKLPIPTSGAPPTLAAAFAASVAPEELDDYECTVCKARTRATIQTAISRLPHYMFVVLKRFTAQRQKIQGVVSYDPDAIPLAAYCAWAGSSTYRVIATVEHHGGIRGGHYCMRAREGSQWNVYDDAQIGNAGHGQGMPDTYILVLERLKSE